MYKRISLILVVVALAIIFHVNSTTRAVVAEPARYVATLNQVDDNAPTAVVAENTLGSTISFTYDDVGGYYTSGYTFPSGGRTVCFISNAGSGTVGCARAEDGTVNIFSAFGWDAQNSLIRNASIEIRVYP